MLKLEHVSKTFNLGTVNEKKALQDLNLTVNDGDFITIIGGNGAGKSTTLNMIAGVYPIDCGYITIDNQDISLADEYKRAKFIGRVFQDPMMGTAANMEIQENLAMAFRRGKRRGLSWGISKEEKKQYHEALKRLDLGLETRMSSKVGLLSGGQRQALTLLMATLQKPKILLLDEHTAYTGNDEGGPPAENVPPPQHLELDFAHPNELRAQLSGHKGTYNKFDYIVHCAGVTKCVDKNEFDLVNYLQTKYFIDTLRELNMIPKQFIFISTLSVFGPVRERNCSILQKSVPLKNPGQEHTRHLT